MRKGHPNGQPNNGHSRMTSRYCSMWGLLPDSPTGSYFGASRIDAMMRAKLPSPPLSGGMGRWYFASAAVSCAI